MREMQVRSLGREDPLEKEMAPHSSVLAWRIPGMGEPCGLLSMGSRRVRHDWSDLAMRPLGEGNGNPLQCSCLENPRDGGALWTAIYGVAQSRTRVKSLSSSSLAGRFKSPFLKKISYFIMTERTNKMASDSWQIELFVSWCNVLKSHPNHKYKLT